MASKLGHIRD